MNSSNIHTLFEYLIIESREVGRLYNLYSEVKDFSRSYKGRIRTLAGASELESHL